MKAAHQREAASVLEAGRAVRDDAVELRRALGQTIENAETRLRARLRRDPYTTLGALVGVGYILGGGLRSLLTRQVLSVGSWMVVEQVVNGLRRPEQGGNE